MLSRRGFPIGTGGLLTAAFVKDAQSFVLRDEQPLLVPPPQIAQTLFWYDSDEQGLMLTIGEWDVCPPPPTWREYFVGEGIPHRTESEAHRIWTEHGIEPADYDEPVDESWWKTRFDLRRYALRFATREEALKNAEDLMMRWWAVKDYRAVECDDPFSHTYVDHQLGWVTGNSDEGPK